MTQLTTQQEAFVKAVVRTKSNLVLRARAGTGKTTTILYGVDAYAEAFPEDEIIVCAFNKSIADEVSEKLKKRGHSDWKKCKAATIHSLGFGLVKFIFKPVVKDSKVRDLVREQAGTDNSVTSVFSQYEAQIVALVNFAKIAGFGFFPDCQIGSKDAWYALADEHDINGFEDDTTEMDRVVEAAQFIYRMSLERTNVVDFNDMVLFPLIKNLRVKFPADLVIIDEYQDTSRARQALARKFVRPVTGRMIAVGDDRQAIYGFAGADSDALDTFAKEMEATVLPLTQTWRCGRAIVSEAQRLVPDIEAATERDGAVSQLTALAFREAKLEKTDAILCRNTAPLIELAYSMIRRGIPCKVEGRAIGDGLKNLAQRWKIKTISAFLTKLEDWTEKEVQKYLAKSQDSKAEAIKDRSDCLKEICLACLLKNKQNISDVVEFIDALFADGATCCLILATYHRSKGREWDRVFLYEHAARCPSKAARQEWQKKQETNLAYVAITRAKEQLVYVN